MVKLLLAILLFSFNSQAEFKVDIVNKHGNQMSQTLDTEAEAQAYIARVKHRWGREQGWYKKQCSDSLEARDVMLEQNTYGTRFEDVLNEETQLMENIEVSYVTGTEQVLDYKEYHCPKNYSAIISDITAQEDVKRAEKQAKKDDRLAIKASIQKVKDSDLPVWHKRFIIHQMKEMRE